MGCNTRVKRKREMKYGGQGKECKKTMSLASGLLVVEFYTYLDIWNFG